MSPEDYEPIAAIIEHLVTAAAILIGGGWVFYQYVLRRAGESAVSIDAVTHVESANGGLRSVFVDIELANTGQTRIDASRLSGSELASRFEGSLRCAGSLQIRRVGEASGHAGAHVDWWKSGYVLPLEIPEVDLLFEYSDEHGRPDFFMEPGEKYHLGNLFVLPTGIYLAKVVFVGKHTREFWSRIFPIFAR